MRLRFAAALAAAAVLLAPVALAQTGGVDQEAIAKRLVAAAGIHEGDLEMDPAWSADIPPARREARNAAGRQANATMLSRKVRIVNLGSGLFPNAQNAALYGIPKADLEKLFWPAVAADPAQLQSTGAALKAVLGAGRELRITHPNGTDLRVRIEGRRPMVSDGVISPEEAQAGGGENFELWSSLPPTPGLARRFSTGS
jgi:leucyl aminopeptidase (aminopeptidase T)